MPIFGAGDEARTRYLHLGKVALYQMSYTREHAYYSRFCGFVKPSFQKMQARDYACVGAVVSVASGTVSVASGITRPLHGG